jgi:hypothetical protein
VPARSPLRFGWSLALALALGVGAVPAQQQVEVFPLEPSDRAVVGPRSVFHVGYRGLGEDAPRGRRFRIVLKAEWIDGESFVFDQRNERGGWTPGEPGRMLYRPRRPLPDGSYTWSVAIWSGTVWTESTEDFRLRVDSVPPAAVAGLGIRYDHESEIVELEWEPVTLDAEGGAEFVARYHVYRYPRADLRAQVRPYEVVTTEQTRVSLPVEAPQQEKIWFYRVTAEDLAGNEAGRPE